jgi:deazaflavin-dependent oxidoreductase (nitroreductase family)
MARDTGTIRIPPKGTRGQSFPGQRVLTKVFKPIMDRQVARIKNRSNPEQPRMMGFPVLLLTTVGAKTGNEHTHILGGFPDGDDVWLVVATNGGAANHPGWFINVAKNPNRVWAQVANRRFRANVESLQGTAREEAYARISAGAKNYASYPKKTDREIPVLRVTPAEQPD